MIMVKKESATKTSKTSTSSFGSEEKTRRRSKSPMKPGSKERRRSSLTGLEIATDSESEVEDYEEGNEKEGVEEENQEVEVIMSHKDESNKGKGKTMKKIAPVFKAKSFFKLNNNLISTGKISARHLKANDSQKSSVVKSIWKGKAANPIEEAQASSSIYDNKKSAVSPLVPEKIKKEKTLGKGWFDMKPTSMDSGLKADIKMVEMRNYLDPKRFYKNPDKIRKVLHTGTVIEGAAEYTTARMSRKERKQSLVGEIIADKKIKDYTKRKYVELQTEKEQRRGVKSKGKKIGQRSGVGSGARKVRKLF